VHAATSAFIFSSQFRTEAQIQPIQLTGEVSTSLNSSEKKGKKKKIFKFINCLNKANIRNDLQT
jgi:hypothetical protein